MATTTERITQAVRQVLAKGDDGLRITQAVRQVFGKGADGLRITQAIRQVMFTSDRPATPSIVSASGHTADSVDLGFSTYYHPGGEAHATTRLQVQLAGAGSFTSLVQDNYLGAVELATVSGLAGVTYYEVRMAYGDAEGDYSDWSNTYLFVTTSTPSVSPGGTFDWDDWAQLWNISDSYYTNQGYFSPGGWSGPIDWDPFEPYEGCYDTLTELISAGYTKDLKYNGNVGSFGRLMGPPSILANTVVGANTGVNVATKFSFYSWEAGYSWERYWDCELAFSGVGALICGTTEAPDPQDGWNVWRQAVTWPKTAVYQGIIAYLQPGFSFPYVPCTCWTPQGIAEWANQLLMTCDHYGIGLHTSFHVEVWHDGLRRKAYSIELPWYVAYASTRPRCTEPSPGNPLWQCQHAPWYAVRLKVEKDLVTDPTGKTHNIQASITSPPLSDGEVTDRGHIYVDGQWGLGEAALPNEAGPWDIDEVWVGGNEETAPGEGDGGLYCGWSGLMSNRWTGATSNIFSGGTIYKDFTATVLSTLECGDPCDAESLPDKTPLFPEPTEVDFFLQPCPPDMETADKELYLGEKGTPGGLYKFGGYEVAEGRQLVARLQPNPVHPAGVEGVCHFKNLVITVEHISDIQISIVPILNGERLDQYAQEDVFIGPGDRSKLRRYEMPLWREFEDEVVEGTADNRFTYGLRGTFFTFDMTIVDLCGVGLQLPGVWLDFDVVQEDQGTGVVYTQDLLRAPVFVPTGQVFMGTKGYNRLLKAESGVTDDGVVVEARSHSNPVAPAGAAGECHFKAVVLTVSRWNANAMDLVFTPYLDGEPMAPITINYKATTGPVVEVTEIDLAQSFRHDGADATDRLTYGLRGAWFSARVDTGSGLQEWLGIEGCVLDYDVVQESLQRDVR